MGLLQKLQGLLKTERRVNVEARFERLRTAVSGTMGHFFVAKDRENDKIVGVKLCDPEKVDFFEARFKGMSKPSEGEIAIQMKHPNVVETYEFGMTTKNLPYLVMEFVDGPGLQVIVFNRNEEVVRGKRVNMIRQMAESLHYVHKKGFIHRDVCPRNFIVSNDMNTVKLIDFGLTVPATKDFMAPGNRTGTPLYMAPEVVRRRATDHRLDVFSFGVTCYHLLTFELPWPSAEVNGKAALQHDTFPPTDIFEYRPKLDKSLGNAIMNAINGDVNKRTASMEIFLRNIASVRNEELS